MTSYRFFVLSLLCAVVFTILAERLVYAQGTVVQGAMVTHWTEYIREPGMLPGNSNYYVVSVSKPTVTGITPALGRYFKHGENCGDAGHRTQYDPRGFLNSSSTDRNFEHFHLDFSYPLSGYPVKDWETGLALPWHQSLLSVTVTEAKVEAFWHHYFTVFRPNWTYHGGINPLVNCYGYAFGYSTWVNDPSWVYVNDYRITSYLFTVEPGHLITPTGHVIKVTGVDDYPMGEPMWVPGLKMVTKTLERNRSSGIYEVEWSHTNQPASGFRGKH